MPGMTLAEYLRANRQRRADFAAAIGMSMGGLAKWLNGQRMPSARQMRAIFKVTHGEVTPNDFFPECVGPHNSEAAE